MVIWSKLSLLVSWILFSSLVQGWQLGSRVFQTRACRNECLIKRRGIHPRSAARFSGRGFGENKSKDNNPVNLNSFNLTRSNQTDERTLNLLKRLQSTNLYLVGMMGSGKSTLSKLIAQKLQYRYLDTDAIAEHMCEMPIHQFFKEKPENEGIFRNLEYQILMETSKYTRVVFATGGGIVMKKENWGVLHHGIVIYLHLLPHEIYERLQRNPEEIAKRPLLSPVTHSVDSQELIKTPLQRLEEIYEARKENYQQADITINLSKDMTAEETADIILDKLLDFIVNHPPQRHEWKKKRDQRIYDMAIKVSTVEYKMLCRYDVMNCLIL